MDQTNYHRNSLENNTPYTRPPEQGGYEHYPTEMAGHLTGERSEKFTDYFTQPKIFWHNLHLLSNNI